MRAESVEGMSMLGADDGADDGAGPSGSQGSHPDAGWTPFEVLIHTLSMCDSVNLTVHLCFDSPPSRHFRPSQI